MSRNAVTVSRGCIAEGNMTDFHRRLEELEITQLLDELLLQEQ